MIASLRGMVQGISEGELVLEVGGVGLRVLVPTSVLDAAPAVGNTMFLHTYMALRQDSMTLYGFTSPEERELFTLLLQVGGVGPRLAIAVLSHLSPDMLKGAVVSGQPEALVTVPGIGQKTAERIVFHLKDKLPAPVGVGLYPCELDQEILEALSGLGYGMLEAQDAMRAIPPDAPEELESRLRLALQHLSRS